MKGAGQSLVVFLVSFIEKNQDTESVHSAQLSSAQLLMKFLQNF